MYLLLQGFTPLHIAVTFGHMQAARMLLTNGANPDVEALEVVQSETCIEDASCLAELLFDVSAMSSFALAHFRSKVSLQCNPAGFFAGHHMLKFLRTG